MIKEKPKVTKYNRKKTRLEVCAEYLKTIGASMLIGVCITVFLAVHARNEMIKNMYTENTGVQIDKKIAEEIIQNNDLISDIHKQNFTVCLQVGSLYETIGDLKNAQIAYQYALNKAKPNNYKAHYRMISVMLAQEKFSAANELLNDTKDKNSVNLVKFKTKANILMGDKYYSIGKYLSAAKSFEKALYYYNKLEKPDKVVIQSYEDRIVNSYLNVADIMVKNSRNSDAIRFLRKAEKYRPDDYKIKYKLAIVLSDAEPEASVEYLELLLDKIPQEIDYELYGRTLLKAAKIAELDGRPTQAKYYRYKIHSIDLFVDKKVVYKNDIEARINAFSSRKKLFTYPLKLSYEFFNVSSNDINNLHADFILKTETKTLETITKKIADKEHPLIAANTDGNNVKISFKKNIFTKKELNNYFIEIYLYKDKRYKTLFSQAKLPAKSFNLNKFK